MKSNRSPEAPAAIDLPAQLRRLDTAISEWRERTGHAVVALVIDEASGRLLAANSQPGFEPLVIAGLATDAAAQLIRADLDSRMAAREAVARAEAEADEGGGGRVLLS